ncbi:Hpt domain-containing protein [Leeia sp.]|uniref:Hpt domain-containing protein n=1 Tax=Leeia sp. TaxID=2884678 RepID=UPI0035B394D2
MPLIEAEQESRMWQAQQVWLLQGEVGAQASLPRMLQRFGCRVHLSRLAEPQTAAPACDLILLDAPPDGEGVLATLQMLAVLCPQPQRMVLQATSGFPSEAACLQAGAQRVWPKPLDMATLESVLTLPYAPLPLANDTAATPVSPMQQAIEQQVLQLGVPLQLVQEAARLLLAQLPERLAALQLSVRERDYIVTQQRAHSLKGALGNFIAVSPYEPCRQIDLLTKAKGDWPAIEAQLAILLQDYPVFADTLTQMLDALPSSPVGAG